MRFRPLALAGALLASLALASSAQAAPTAPVVKPIPYFQCGTTTVGWTPSTPDPGGAIVGYRIDLGDLTTGTATAKFTTGLSLALPGLVNGHKYVVRVRALQKLNGVLTYSWPGGRVFKKLCPILPAEIVREYVEYNPFPECIMCGLESLRIDDVRVLPGPETFGGMVLEADGSVRFLAAR